MLICLLPKNFYQEPTFTDRSRMYMFLQEGVPA